MLEDTFGDILGKARWGRNLSAGALASQCGISPGRIAGLETGEAPNAEEISALATALDLHPGRLRAIAEGQWHPAPTPGWIKDLVLPIEGHIGSYAVWGYLLFDEAARTAVLIDTAYDPRAVLGALVKHRLKLTAILLTHAHPDHIGGLEEIYKETRADVYLHPDERVVLGKALPGSHPVGEDLRLPVGRTGVTPLFTPGHTPGGTTYVAEGETRRVAFTGDALFAGSVGRSRSSESYPQLLQGIRRKILSLPDETPLFPGHGPPTSVGEEKQNNPFFP